MAKSDEKPQLTDSAIKKIIDDYAEHGTKTELIDIRTPGLRILPLKNNRAKWSLMVRDQSGQLKRFSLGEYPALGIKKARDAAEITRHQVRHKGEDPNAERQAKREAARTPPPPELTLQEVIDLYAAVVGPVRKSWWTAPTPEPGRTDPIKLPDQAKRGDGKRRVESVFATHLASPAKRLTRAELLKTIDTWPSRTSAAAAVRYVKPMFKWAVARDYMSPELVLLEQPAGAVKKRLRYLDEKELAVLLPVLENFKSRSKPSMHAKALRFMLLTAVRLDEVCQARWCEVSDKLWIIPGTRIKNTKPDKVKLPFTIPLPRQAVALLETVKQEGSKPTDLIFPNRHGTPLSNWDKVTKQIFVECGFGGWARHDLRRTASTSMGHLGISSEIAEGAALNHTDIRTALGSNYNQSRYTPQLRKALQKLADWYDKVKSEKDAASGKPGTFALTIDGIQSVQDDDEIPLKAQ